MDWPADTVERKPLRSLVPYARNARTHSEAQVAQLAGSIREWGFTMPILVDEAGSIIAGHGRVLAADRLGIGDVPVITARGWSEAQKQAYRIADNKLALNAGWDEQLLGIEIADLASGEFNLDLIGFNETELAKLLGTNTGLTDPDAAPDVPVTPASSSGEVWLLGKHRLACGDSTRATDVAAALGGVTPHLMVTDPPYGVDYDPKWRAERGVNNNRLKMGEVVNDERPDWREAWALFPGDVAYVWHASWFTAVTQASLEASGFAIRCEIIWAKDRFALSRGDYHWQHEPCWYAVRNGKTGHWASDRSQTTLWQIPAREDDGHGHGTQKPVECMRRPIENNSSAGQAVYDPFVGSGTTIIAAEMTARACHALEINPAYVDVAIKRWQDFTGAQARREADGQLFDDVEQTNGTPAPDADAAENLARQSGEAGSQ
jgi:DNA modification methylase